MQTLPRPAATFPLYTRPALIALSQGMRRRFMAELVLIPVLMAAAAGGGTKVIGTTGQTTDIAVLFALLASPVVAALAAHARVRRSPRCPACAERLVTTSGILRLRGDGCGSCGARIIGPGPERPPVLGTREAFMARYHALARRYRIWMWITGGALVVAVAGMYGLGEGWLPGSLELPVIVAGIVFMAAGFVAFVNGWPSAIRRAGLACPTCNDPLVGGRGGFLTRHTLSTGTCPWCSAPAWS